jgi:WD40 repeat protein
LIKGIQAPHGNDLIAVLSADGTLRVSPFKKKQFPAYIYPTGIKSPNSVRFSEDGSKLIVIGNHTLMLFVSDRQTPEGLPHFRTPVQINPPNGRVSFSDEGIIVTGDDGKETRYDLDGNEIK